MKHGMKNFGRMIGASLVLLTATLPLVSFAYFGSIDTFFTNANTFVGNILLPVLFTVSLFFFVYGVFNYFILNGASDESREKGKNFVIYAIIGFVIMTALWGIVNLFQGGLLRGMGNPGDTAPPTPSVPTPAGTPTPAPSPCVPGQAGPC